MILIRKTMSILSKLRMKPWLLRLSLGKVVKKNTVELSIFFFFYQRSTVNTHTFFWPDIYKEKHCVHICIKRNLA